MCPHTIYVSSYPRMRARGTRMRVSVRPYYYMFSYSVYMSSEGEKNEDKSARACHASYMVIGGTKKKNQGKKMNTRASMRAEALDVKAHVELVLEVQLTVVCWS